MKTSIVCVALCLCATPCLADGPWDRMQYGPFLQSSVTMPWSTDGEELDGITLKGTTVRLEHGASVCFDTDLLRYSGGWSGGWLKVMGTPFDGTHRPPERSRPAVEGKLVFGSSPIPGWSLTGAFNDPRPEPYGPIPAEIAKYRGLYVRENRVAFEYTVGDCTVLESPGAEKAQDQLLLTRKSAKLSPDGLNVFLETQPLAPVMQIAVRVDVDGADGKPIVQAIYGTINKLPD